jgi:N-acetylmuramoyl-L-alanine amidase
MKKIFLILLVLILTTSVTVAYGESIVGYTNISDIGIYKSTNYASSKLCILKLNSKVEILKEENEWYKVQSEDGSIGWIEKYFITIPAKKYVVNNASYSVNIRKGPSTSSEQVGQLLAGEQAKYISTYHSWHIIEYKNSEYYIASWLTDLVSDGSDKIYLLYDEINIRDSSSVNSNIIAIGNKYDAYAVYEEKNGWLKIKLSDDKYGYIAGWLTSYDINYYFKGNIDYKYTTDGLNIRSGPSIDYTKIESLASTTFVKIISSENGWDKIVTNDGQIGWCKNDYLQSTLPLYGKKILLDPGHGGKDPGCISYSGNYEKYVNLTVSTKLKDKLETLGATVYMTRTDDTYINNIDRGKMADTLGVDILLSIHHNSLDSDKSDYFGLSTYYNTINYTSKRYGYDLAEAIYLNAITLTGVYKDGIYDRNYQVLRETNTPAALIEIGFMSNPQEELNVNTDSFQILMVEKIANGIMDYFK